MSKKVYRKGGRSVEITENKVGIHVSFLILGVIVNFYDVPLLNSSEKQMIFEFLHM